MWIKTLKTFVFFHFISILSEAIGWIFYRTLSIEISKAFGFFQSLRAGVFSIFATTLPVHKINSGEMRVYAMVFVPKLYRSIVKEHSFCLFKRNTMFVDIYFFFIIVPFKYDKLVKNTNCIFDLRNYLKLLSLNFENGSKSDFLRVCQI